MIVNNQLIIKKQKYPITQKNILLNKLDQEIIFQPAKIFIKLPKYNMRKKYPKCNKKKKMNSSKRAKKCNI